MGTFATTVVLGILATALMDLWGLARPRLLGWPRPDYRLVGRWFAHIGRGRFRHHAIAAAPPRPGELAIGWAAHYLIGTSFAGLLVGGWGDAWLARPTLGPPLLVGIGTVAAPLLLMQPAMGAGIASARTRRPWQARLQSLVTHAVFGLGLYGAGWVTHALHTLFH
jgi:hypothetical protein